ncbi:MAG: ribonuclease P protein component [Bryobacteraceae bacterium]
MRSSEFRKVYQEGFRVSSKLFAAFCLRTVGLEEGPKVGFTTPRALGKSVLRNRIKRRMREAVRLHLNKLSPKWSIIFNPRRAVLTAPFPEIESEVLRVFSRCEAS